MEEQAEKEEERAEGAKLAEAMNGAYKSFRVDGRGKTDVDSYIALVKPRIHKLIEEQVKELNAAKVQMHLWIM